MASTLSLARMNQSEAESCRSKPEPLDRLISFSLLPPDHYLELDWLDSLLDPLLKLFGTADDIAAAHSVLVGTEVLNPSFPSGTPAYEIWDGEIRWSSPATIRSAAARLSWPSLASFIDSLPASPEAARSLLRLRDFDGDPKAYLRLHCRSLATFVDAATHAGEGIAAWWD